MWKTNIPFWDVAASAIFFIYLFFLGSACSTVIVFCKFLFCSDSLYFPLSFQCFTSCHRYFPHLVLSHDSHLCLVVGLVPDRSQLPSCINSSCLPLCMLGRGHNFVFIKARSSIVHVSVLWLSSVTLTSRMCCCRIQSTPSFELFDNKTTVFLCNLEYI